MIIDNFSVRTTTPLSAGTHRIDVFARINGPGKSDVVKISADGTQAGAVELKQTVPAAFTAMASFDVGTDLGAPVSPSHEERRPFEFTGEIDKMAIELT